MAGQGFKDFSVGEVLTSADVDGYLMQQSVMRFADAGARGSALGTAVGTGVPLAEGMVSYLDDLNQVQVFDGTSWAATGKVLQVVQTVKTDAFSSTSTTYTAVTGLAATITPASNTSKVLLLASVNIGLNHSNVTQANHFRITGGNIGANYYGDAASSRERVWASLGFSETNWGPARGMVAVSGIYLDSPATTSATTYQVEGRREGADSVVVNRTGVDSDAAYAPRGVSSITLIEVAA